MAFVLGFITALFLMFLVFVGWLIWCSILDGEEYNA